MASQRFTVQHGYGKPVPALHPEKREALRQVLVGKPKKKDKVKPGKEVPLPRGDSLQLIDRMAYRIHDPGFRSYFNRPDLNA